MFTEKQLCEKIVSLYPDIGVCGIDIKVALDHSEKAWVVHMNKDTHSLDHFLALMDAERCMQGKECLALGLDIAQLKKNIDGKQF
ncbi:hypothetical protein [Desulfopila sp. IMCC35008]|uniref:hypothetical protein n=1 Tax=Desulfopila sp. IMCC35008 TaxID=2653858 RepID=UPI0013D42082|nr:hypothetical protein [Desulfopila sp. IMCC35008]